MYGTACGNSGKGKGVSGVCGRAWVLFLCVALVCMEEAGFMAHIQRTSFCFLRSAFVTGGCREWRL